MSRNAIPGTRPRSSNSKTRPYQSSAASRSSTSSATWLIPTSLARRRSSAAMRTLWRPRPGGRSSQPQCPRQPAERITPAMRAIQITEFGGPEVLEVRDVSEPEVPDGFMLADVRAAGVNYGDTHQAENSYIAKAELPLIPGGELVGTTSD